MPSRGESPSHCGCWFFLPLNRCFTIRSERKYLLAGSASKMSDNKDTLPALRKEISAIDNLPFCIVPHFMKGIEDCSEGSPVVVAKESCNIFKEQQVRSFLSRNPSDFKK